MTKRYPAQRRFDAKYDQTRPRAVAFRLDEPDHQALAALAREGESVNQVAKRLVLHAIAHGQVEVASKPTDK